MFDDSSEFLVCTRKEPWHIRESDDGNLEGVTESHEPSCLD
jgi:hypothetical protein